MDYRTNTENVCLTAYFDHDVYCSPLKHFKDAARCKTAVVARTNLLRHNTL